MEKVALGTKVKPLGINRCVCAQGCKSRAILLDRDPRVKFIGWDEKRKRRVELNQDLVIKYGFRPMTNYYYLIARLNTDMKGNVIGNDFVVEYLQLSDNINSDFASDVEEHPNFKSIAMELVKKTGPGGKDFSYIDVKTSEYVINQEILDKVQQLRDMPDAIDKMWVLIDTSTSITAEEYEKLIAEEANGGAPQVTAGQRPTTQASLEARNYQPQTQISGAVPADVAPETNEFGSGDGFGDEDDFKEM